MVHKELKAVAKEVEKMVKEGVLEGKELDSVREKLERCKAEERRGREKLWVCEMVRTDGRMEITEDVLGRTKEDGEQRGGGAQKNHKEIEQWFVDLVLNGSLRGE